MARSPAGARGRRLPRRRAGSARLLPGCAAVRADAYTLAALVGDVLGLADAVGAEAFDLVGHDWGAVIAWRTAALHPDRVRSLTAVSVPHPAALATALRTDDDQRERSSYMRLFRQEEVAERALTEDGWRRFRELFAGAAVPPADIDRYIDRLSAPGALTAALNYYRAPHTRLEDGAIEVPTLFVWSTNDWAFGRTAAEATAEHVAGPYRLVVLEGVSHFVPEDAPGELADALLAHLAWSPPGRASD